MPKLATFRGKHNLSKSRLLLYLHIVDNSPEPKLQTAYEIDHAIPELTRNYLDSRLPDLAKWGYISRSAQERKGRLVWGYKIAIRGDQFLTARIPVSVFRRLIAEFEIYYPSWSSYFNEILERKIALIGDDEAEPEIIEPESTPEPVVSLTAEDLGLPKYIVCPDFGTYEGQQLLFIYDWQKSSYRLGVDNKDASIPDSIRVENHDEAHRLGDEYRELTEVGAQ